MRQISLSDARSREWDVIVAGSSFAAMFFAHALPAHLAVLVIEKGSFRAHDVQVHDGWAVRENIVQRNTSGLDKVWLAFTVFGGNSNYWWGNAPRLHPDDFALKSRFGVGEDWLFGYDELEPYWTAAENIMEVAGGESDHILPRSAPFPYPPHEPMRSDVALRASSNLWVPLPTGISNGGSRSTCCVNGICRTCPVDAKFTILNGFQRLAHPGAHFLLDTEVRALDIEAGQARQVRVRGADGEEAAIRGSVFALGANGIFNAAILLRSGIASPALGRYLHEQALRDVFVDTTTIKGFFGGTSETGHGYHFYHGVDRSEAAAVLIETVNAPPHIRLEPKRWADRIHLRVIAEDLPQPENRVLLENDEPILEWVGHSEYAYRGLTRALDGLADIIPDKLDGITTGPFLASEAHIQGTHRMGSDPAQSVVDAELRLHEAPNVFALGAGAFPACSPSNPSLTIAALSLRAGEAVR